MIRVLKHLWRNEAGFIVSAELVLISTVLVIGIMAGLSCVQKAVVQELNDVGAAFTSIDQGYSYSGMHGCRTRCGTTSWTNGSAFGTCEEPGFVYTPDILLTPTPPTAPAPVPVYEQPLPSIPCPPLPGPTSPAPYYQGVPCPQAPVIITPTPCPCGV